MPRNVKRIKYAPYTPVSSRARAAAKGFVKKYRTYRKYANNTGTLVLTRKTSMISIYSSATTAGVVTLNDPTGNCLSLGTPVLINGSVNCYDIPFAFKFRLDQIQNANELTALFDKYRLLNVLIKAHNNWYNTNSALAQPWIEYISDHDDGLVPTVGSMRERMGSKEKYFSATKQVIQMGCRPRFADNIYQNGTSALAYGLGNRREYINMTYPGVEHFGIKGVIHGVYLPGIGSGGSIMDFDVSLKIITKDIL